MRTKATALGVICAATFVGVAPFGCEPRAGESAVAAQPTAAQPTAAPPTPTAAQAGTTPTPTSATAPTFAAPTFPSMTLPAVTLPQPPALLSFELPFAGLGGMFGGKRREVLRIEPRTTTLSVTESMMEKITPGGAPRLVFLNRMGGIYYPGASSAAGNKTNIFKSVATIPPYEKGEASWAKVSACVRGHFTRWNIQFTESDPGSAAHVEVVVGGHPSLGAMEGNVGGVAMMVSDCSVANDTIAFVFSKIYGANEQQNECETIAHELGHTLGLDHEFHCPDPMTYLEGCGVKSFKPAAVACGESKARPCACGPTQSSVAVLDKNLGISSGSPTSVPDPGKPVAVPTAFPFPTGIPTSFPTAAPTPVPTSAPTAAPTTPKPTPTAPKGDGKGPTIALLAPATATKVASGSEAVVIARIDDKDGVGKVLLRWKMGAQSSEIDCAAPPAGVSCNSVFGTWAFRIPAGKGTRTWSIRAIDKVGNETMSEERTVSFDEGAPNEPMPTGVVIPPPPANAPSILTLDATLDAPDDGKVHRWGDTVPVKVTVKGLATSVQVVWRGPFGDEIQPLTKGPGDTWTGNFVVPKLAVIGPRQIRAIVQGPTGATAETKTRNVTILP